MLRTASARSSCAVRAAPDPVAIAEASSGPAMTAATAAVLDGELIITSGPRLMTGPILSLIHI